MLIAPCDNVSLPPQSIFEWLWLLSIIISILYQKILGLFSFARFKVVERFIPKKPRSKSAPRPGSHTMSQSARVLNHSRTPDALSVSLESVTTLALSDDVFLSPTSHTCPSVRFDVVEPFSPTSSVTSDEDSCSALVVVGTVRVHLLVDFSRVQS